MKIKQAIDFFQNQLPTAAFLYWLFMIMLIQAFSTPLTLNCLLFPQNKLKMRLFYLFLFSSAEQLYCTENFSALASAVTLL